MRITEVKKIRLVVGLTQEEFAKELGLSRMTIASWEIGRNKVSASSIKKLIKFCQDNKIRIAR